MECVLYPMVTVSLKQEVCVGALNSTFVPTIHSSIHSFISIFSFSPFQYTMAAIGVIAAAASTALVAVGARAAYKSLTAERGLTLPSLKAVTSQMTSGCAYPEDYFPGKDQYNLYDQYDYNC
jgi:hypothetical protein